MSNQTQLSIFNFEQSSIRVIAVNNEPWFVAKDLCDVLGVVNSRDALSKLDEDEKTTVGLTDSQAGKGAQSISLVSESGMYTLILRCRDAVKKGSVPHRFRKWVTAEVLPQIRKTGQYSAQQQLALPEPEKKYTFEFTEDTCLRFVSMWFALYNNLELLGQLHQPLSNIGSHFGSTAYTHYTEYKTILGTMKSVLEPMTKEFNPDPRDEAHYCKALKTLRSYQLQGLAKIVKHPTPPTRKYDF
ncbi:MAG: Bro-N domain-containing protein [[Actinobacillus] rossii]|nr:Bro-N domain-containing protein [[Actinobacillus] rossii]MDY4506152.1 Bro-N domain-containing protein [[Actinobacillus] rossii]